MVKRLIPFFIVLTFSIISVLPLFHSGLHPTHDGEYHIIRFWQFFKVFSEGNLFPRWAPDLNNGFGVPLFTYQYPLPNYIATLTHYLGLSYINSFKYNLFLAAIVGSATMYLYSKEYFGNLGGVLSSVVYTFAPYKLLNIYVRGSVGEIWALSIAPILFWSLYKYTKTNSRMYFILSTFFYLLLIVSHNILGLLFFVISIFYIFFLFYFDKIKLKIWQIFLPVILGLGLSSPFWFVALLEKQYVRGLDVFDFTRHFPEIYELIIPSWGTGFSGGELQNQMSFQIGIVNILIVLVIIGIIIWKGLKKEIIKERIIYFFLLILFVSLFMMNSVSGVIWNYMPLISFLQFPWRFLSLVIFLISIMAGFISKITPNNKINYLLVSLLIFLAVITTINYTKPAYYHKRQDGHYLSRDNFTKGTNSVGNAFNTKWLSDLPLDNSKERKYRIAKRFEFKSNERVYLVDSRDDQIFYPNIAYFPGWEAKVNGEPRDIINENGVIGVRLNNELSLIKIKYTATFSQNIATTFFIVSILYILIWLIYPAIIKRWL